MWTLFPLTSRAEGSLYDAPKNQHFRVRVSPTPGKTPLDAPPMPYNVNRGFVDPNTLQVRTIVAIYKKKVLF